MTWSIAWIFMATAPLLAQYTASDDCGFLAGNAYTVDPACIPRPFHKPAGANASFTPGTCNASTNADVFGWFEATGPSTTLNFAPNNGEDPALHVFTGSCGALTQVACANSPGPGSEDLVIPTVSGQTYLIRVQTTGSDNPMPDAQICIFATPPPPANDEPCTAMLLSADSACTNVVAASNSSATASLDLPDPGCFYTGEPDIWFAAVVPASGHLRVDTHADAMGPGDSGMALYTAEGCAQSMALIACNDDQSATDHMPSIDQTGLTPGDTIYIRFWAFYGGDGAFQVCASPNTSTLPVELISFNAVGAHGGIQLDWTTASETNSAHFTVERSSDALSFMPLIRMPAAGNSQGYRTYSFLDKTPPTGLNYYRLLQTDLDGAAQVSNVVACWANAPASLLIYPNPVADVLFVRLPRDVPAGTTLWVAGSMDRTTKQLQVRQPAGRSRLLEADTHALAPGQYFVRLVGADGETSPVGSFLKI